MMARAVHRARHRASGFRTQRQLTPSQTQSATKYHPARQLSAFGENSLLLRSDEGVNPVRRKHWDFSSRDLKCSVIYLTRRQKGMRTIQKSTFKWGSNKSHSRPLSWSLRTGFSIDYIFRTESCLFGPEYIQSRNQIELTWWLRITIDTSDYKWKAKSYLKPQRRENRQHGSGRSASWRQQKTFFRKRQFQGRKLHRQHVHG